MCVCVVTCDKDAGLRLLYSLLQDLLPDEIQQPFVECIAVPAGQEASMHAGPCVLPAGPSLRRVAHSIRLPTPHHFGQSRMFFCCSCDVEKLPKLALCIYLKLSDDGSRFQTMAAAAAFVKPYLLTQGLDTLLHGKGNFSSVIVNHAVEAWPN